MPSTILLLPSEQRLSVEAHESILDAALRAGLNLPHSCKGGHCSSCRARVLAGVVRYPGERPLGLAEHEERAGYALLCQARPASTSVTVEVSEQRPPAPDIEVRSLPCRIERTTLLAPDVMAVFLRLPASEEFSYAAGQYIDVMLSQQRRRSFSIANAPHQDALIELHVRRVAGGEFTDQLFCGAKERMLLRIEGPLGQFWFRDDSSRPALMIGGGTGYAPLRAMLRERLSRGDRRMFYLYWGGQSATDLYEHEQVLAWCARHPNLQYVPVISGQAASDSWDGRRGWVHAAALADHPDLAVFERLRERTAGDGRSCPPRIRRARIAPRTIALRFF